MKNILLGLILGLTLMGVSIWSYRIVMWRSYVNNAAFNANDSSSYLNEVVVNAGGKSYTRKDILDFMIANTVKAANSQTAAK